VVPKPSERTQKRLSERADFMWTLSGSPLFDLESYHSPSFKAAKKSRFFSIFCIHLCLFMRFYVSLVKDRFPRSGLVILMKSITLKRVKSTEFAIFAGIFFTPPRKFGSRDPSFLSPSG
jgi:hypothetical protein